MQLDCDMAEGPRSLEYLLTCPVCYEDFQENGDHVPRLLPCSHTSCEQCIKQLIQYNKLKCPECKSTHKTPDKEKSFPQNKYVLTYVRRQAASVDEEEAEVKLIEACEEHWKELILFCRTEACQKPICPTCLTRTHQEHKVVEIEEEKIAELCRNIESVERKLEAKVKTINKSKEDIEKKTGTNITKMKKVKEEMNRKFDKMIEETEDEMSNVQLTINNEVCEIKENLELLKSIKENTAEEPRKYEEIMNKLETVNGIDEITKEHFSGRRSYMYLEYLEGEALGERVCGKMLKMEIVVDISAEDVVVPDYLRNITHASQFNYRGKSTVRSPHPRHTPMAQN